MKRAEKSYFQSKVFVCVSTNCADAVDRLLNFNRDTHSKSSSWNSDSILLIRWESAEGGMCMNAEVFSFSSFIAQFIIYNVCTFLLSGKTAWL